MSDDTKPQITEKSPPAGVVSSELFRELRDCVARETDAFTFACGGTIPIVPRAVHSGSPDDTSLTVVGDQADRPDSPTSEIFRDGEQRRQQRLRRQRRRRGEPDAPPADTPADNSLSVRTGNHGPCFPVDIRWDAATPGEARKITLPLTADGRDGLEGLLEDMLPATFGRDNKDVYDESYRKAGKMDPATFSTSFCPYQLGIVDAVAQALLPSLRRIKMQRDVRAELYKLNVYSAPSGKFKAHVDTPRSPSQFGSLVVNLPLNHQGGALEVRHKGRSVAFDWGADADCISWAAFYSDCEHEVFEVTDGHRLTLTYNLYCVRGNGQMGGDETGVLDPTTLPLYKTVRDVVQFPSGWPKGGYVGFHCAHVYPHTATNKLNFLAPDNLKGADMLMYTTFRHLGLDVGFRPYVKNKKFQVPNDEEEVEGLAPDDYDENWDTRPALGDGEKLGIEFWDEFEDVSRPFQDWTGRLCREHDSSGKKQRAGYLAWNKVDWLNESGHEEPQISYIAYGNESFASTIYSSFAIVAKIPADVSEVPEDAGVEGKTEGAGVEPEGGGNPEA